LISREIARRLSRATTTRDESFSIVLTSSIYGTLGPNPSLYKSVEMRNPAAYGASKAALESLARYLSATSAGRMRVNSVAAGGIQRGQDDGFVSEYSSRTPVGRMATEDDILQVIKFLLGEESRYVFGQTLLADGGFSIW
jgi:NAD(P)-dependent dehydrogenase (short-subunit alcohol dehydrogenase family)